MSIGQIVALFELGTALDRLRGEKGNSSFATTSSTAFSTGWGFPSFSSLSLSRRTTTSIPSPPGSRRVIERSREVIANARRNAYERDEREAFQEAFRIMRTSFTFHLVLYCSTTDLAECFRQRSTMKRSR